MNPLYGYIRKEIWEKNYFGWYAKSKLFDWNSSNRRWAYSEYNQIIKQNIPKIRLSTKKMPNVVREMNFHGKWTFSLSNEIHFCHDDDDVVCGVLSFQPSTIPNHISDGWGVVFFLSSFAFLSFISLMCRFRSDKSMNFYLICFGVSFWTNNNSALMPFTWFVFATKSFVIARRLQIGRKISRWLQNSQTRQIFIWGFPRKSSAIVRERDVRRDIYIHISIY